MIRQWLQLGLQEAYRPLIEEFHHFHDFTNIILIFILSFVLFIIVSIVWNTIINKNLLQGQLIECIWTTVPGLILVQIALPSLSLLYLIEDAPNPNLSIKAIGHQWYWEYEYSDFWWNLNTIRFDAYIINENDLKPGIFRQLETDNRLVVPYSWKIRMLITRADVLHSWTVPSLGVKADAVPGRLNQVNFVASIPGVVYGQCSEICGRQHSNMPIAIEITNINYFTNWFINLLED